MKSLINTLLCLALLGVAQQAVAKLSIFTCEPEWASLATELGGDNVNVFSATTGLQDPHHIQARPSLIAKARRADLLICSGAELEAGWLPMLLRKAGNADIQPGKPGHFMASEFVSMLGIPAIIDRSVGDVHASGNPHVHTHPDNILLVADALSQRMQRIDIHHAEYYRKRHLIFSQQWRSAMQQWQQRAAPLQGVTVVAQHNGWDYLNAWLGLKQVATLEPKPGIPATSSHLSQVLVHMKSQPAQLILHAAYQDDRPSRWLQARTTIPIAHMAFTVGAVEEVDSLFALFEHSINTLLEALP